MVFSLGKIFLSNEEIIPLNVITHHDAPKLGQMSNTNFRNTSTLKQFSDFRPLEIKSKMNIHKISKA